MRVLLLGAERMRSLDLSGRHRRRHRRRRLLWHSVVKLLGGRVQLVVGRGLQGFRRGWERLNTDTEEDLGEVFKVSVVDGSG